MFFRKSFPNFAQCFLTVFALIVSSNLAFASQCLVTFSTIESKKNVRVQLDQEGVFDNAIKVQKLPKGLFLVGAKIQVGSDSPKLKVSRVSTVYDSSHGEIPYIVVLLEPAKPDNPMSSITQRSDFIQTVIDTEKLGSARYLVVVRYKRQGQEVTVGEKEITVVNKPSGLPGEF